MKRREFLDWITGAVGVTLGAFVAFPIVRYLVPPKIPEASSRRVTAAKKDELKPGSFKIFPMGGRPGILIRTPDGAYRALSAECTHLACTVAYAVKDAKITCACHGGVYDLDGHNVSGPPPRPLERYDVHETGGDIIVDKGKEA